MSLDTLKKKALQDDKVKAEYDKLAPEFELIDQLLSMRNGAGLTQQELAERMGTQKSNVSRLEHGRSNPSWKMLTRYAHACGYELKLTTLERSA
ncbi:helix-turn-helix transcriptional regulator [uncultured Halovibrio sp.]|uniref:helix-turn-helix domain-containing protein n=1 Tax=uncultured Halovibrio sp. TaxID=985049 RepID=UPI0025CF2733|nr:helix-turn-helix transcriptional regulator [uncultured Halovibrio sp.]